MKTLHYAFSLGTTVQVLYVFSVILLLSGVKEMHIFAYLKCHGFFLSEMQFASYHGGHIYNEVVL